MLTQISSNISEINWSIDAVQLGFFGLLVVWVWAIWPKQDFKSLLADAEIVRRAFWVTLIINLLWLLNAGVKPGMDGHFLGLVVLLMMFGWRLASVLALLPVSFFCLFVIKRPADIGVYGLVAVLLPLFISFVFYSLSFRYLPKHLFIYIFFGGFFNAGLMQLTHILAWGAWLWVSTDFDLSTIANNYFVLIPLLGFPEALLNGMALTLLVVYRPQWLFDYSDRHYLWRK